MADERSQLQDWWPTDCDGDWEQQHDIAVNTLDHPGWCLGDAAAS